MKNSRKKREPHQLHGFSKAPLLIPGEDSAAFNDLRGRAMSALRPVDVVEEFYVDVFIRRTWEAMRLRRLQNARLNAAIYEALKMMLVPLLIEGTAISPIQRQSLKDTFAGEADDLAERWRAGHPDAIEKVKALLEESNISMHEVLAATLSLKMTEMMMYENLLRSAEDCVDRAVRELERRRFALAQYAREFRQGIETATAGPSGVHGYGKLLSDKREGTRGGRDRGEEAA